MGEDHRPSARAQRAHAAARAVRRPPEERRGRPGARTGDLDGRVRVHRDSRRGGAPRRPHCARAEFRVGGLPRRHPRVEAQPGAARSDPRALPRSPQGHRGDRGARAHHQPAAARSLHPARERGGIGRPGCALHESAPARGQPRRGGRVRPAAAESECEVIRSCR